MFCNANIARESSAEPPWPRVPRARSGGSVSKHSSEMCVFPLIPRQTGIFFHKMLIPGWVRAVLIHGNGAAACGRGVSGHRKVSCVGPDISDI